MKIAKPPLGLAPVAALSLTVLALAGLLLFASDKPATHSAVVRPPIVGVASVELRTDDMSAARQFYSGLLGFSATSLEGSARFVYFKVNDHQYIQLFNELKDPKESRLVYIAFETTDAEQLRSYLASQGVKVPNNLPPRQDGDLDFDVTDPDGHDIEFVQYASGSVHSKEFGKFMPDSRISRRIIHAGFIVHNRAAEDRFYKDILGFKETWHGAMQDDRTDWVDMRVPDGPDWLEYMLNVHNPDVHLRGVMNHLALGVPDVNAANQELIKRGFKGEKPKIGRDGKWQLNLYDPNLTRVELMEPKPVQKPCCSPMTP
ncbi:MAG: VOC family protein [Terriglobales bacterium]